MRRFNLCLNLYILITFLFFIFFLLESFYPWTVYTLRKDPLPIVNARVKRGAVVWYVTDYCKYVPNPADITVTIEKQLSPDEIKAGKPNGYVYNYPNRNTPTDCHSIPRVQPLPEMMETGRYRLILEAFSRINWIRTFYSKNYSDYFTVE